MYEELIKNLRNCSEMRSLSLYKRDLMKQAADAIEELQKQLREEKVDNVNLTGWLAEEHAKAEDFENKLNLWRHDKISRWIPVTERLPEFDEVVQITDGIEVGHGYLEGIDTTIGVTSFWHSPFCDIDENNITHWMSLPKPPKAGKDGADNG